MKPIALRYWQSPKLPINAVIGEVESDQIHLSGNATNQARGCTARDFLVPGFVQAL